MHSELIAYIVLACTSGVLNLYLCFYVFAKRHYYTNIAMIFILYTMCNIIYCFSSAFGLLATTLSNPVPMVLWASSLLLLPISSSCLFKTMPITKDAIFHSINDGVLVLDESFHLIEFNQASQKMFPQLNKKMLANNFAKVWRELSGAEFPFQLETAAQSMQLQLTAADNSERTYQVRTSLLQNANNSKGLLLIFTDITEHRRLQTQLEHLAYFDELTGINNRRAFFQQCNQLFAEARQDGEAFTVIIMDIDYYKKVNDTYGHYAGDQLLVHVVQACQTQLQGGELFARYGGEEFVFARKSCTAAEGEALANRLRVVAAQPLATSEGIISVTVSLGVAEATNGVEETLSELLNKADQALYVAKQQGRNRVCVFEESLFAFNSCG